MAAKCLENPENKHLISSYDSYSIHIGLCLKDIKGKFTHKLIQMISSTGNITYNGPWS
jgi:hypothetical protein